MATTQSLAIVKTAVLAGRRTSVTLDSTPPPRATGRSRMTGLLGGGVVNVQDPDSTTPGPVRRAEGQTASLPAPQPRCSAYPA